MNNGNATTLRGEANSPLVSVIVPVYNEQRFLGACVSSIIGQTYRNLQVLLVDDGSADNSVACCDAWAQRDSRIEVIHQPNRGVSAARNTGLDAARGEWILFVDADDWLECNAVSTLMSVATQSSAQIIISNYRSVDLTDDEASVRGRKVDYPLASGKISTDKALSLMLGYQGVKGYVWNKCFSAQLIEAGKLRFDSAIGMCEDLLFDVSAATKADTIVAINDCLYNYRVHADSALHTVDARKAVTCMEAHERMLKLAGVQSLSAVEASYATMAEEFLMRTYWKGADSAYRAQYRQVVKRYWRQALHSRVPSKNRVRFLGGLVCPSLFYPLWNRLKGSE